MAPGFLILQYTQETSVDLQLQGANLLARLISVIFRYWKSDVAIVRYERYRCLRLL